MRNVLGIFNNGTDAQPNQDGSASSLIQEIPPPPPALYLTLTVPELRELGCLAASTGSGLQGCKTRLEQIAQARRTAIDAEFQSKNELSAKRLAALEADRDETLKTVGPDGTGRTSAILRQELAKRNADLAGLVMEARSQSLLNTISVQRRIAKEHAEIAEEHIKDRLSRAELLLNVIARDREANKAELERQANRLADRSQTLLQELHDAQKQVADLSQTGITRHVAGFLTWGSSVSLIGAGIAVEQLLHRALASSAIKEEDSLLLVWLRRIQSPLELLKLFGLFMGVVVAAVLIIAVLTMSVRMLLHLSDPSWNKNRGRLRKDDETWNDWLSIFSAPGRPRGTGITDHSLQQIFGLLPVLVTAAAIAFLFLAFGDRSSGSISFIASQLGPAFVTLSVVSAMLFITHVLNASRAKRSMSPLTAFFFGIVSVMPPLSLALSGLVSGRGGPIAITAVGVSMVLASYGLAFGVMYRGLFIRQDWLERIIERVEGQIEFLRSEPTLKSVCADGRLDFDMAVTPLVTQEKTAQSGLFAKQYWWRSLGFLRRQTSVPTSPQPETGLSVLNDLHLTTDQITAISRCTSERDRLQAAADHIDKLSEPYKQANEERDHIGERYRSQLRDLEVETERALIEFENAFEVARASLGEVRTEPSKNTSISRQDAPAPMQGMRLEAPIVENTKEASSANGIGAQ
jgi:hypothetical protein